jgi:hypothetical protein
MKDFKYTTIFSNLTIRPLVAEEKDKYLAIASLMDVSRFVPDLDTDKNIDLLPIAFNAFVANRINRNGDVIDSSTAIEIYKNFVNKPINIEHNRERVVGTILASSFTEFGTDQPLEEEQIKDMKGPFNVTLGGVVWKIVNNDLADMIENSNDPTSRDYQRISASWELGFSDFELAIVERGEKNIENAEIISNEQQIESLKEYLKSFGGSGKLEDGRSVYRKVVNDIVPLGIGLTESPAADVKGVAVKGEEQSENEENNGKNISQSVIVNVNKLAENSTIMKITRIQDITDDSLKTLSASAVADFIEEELKRASEDYSAEKVKYDEQLKDADDKHETLSKDHEELNDKHNTLTKDMQSLKESLDEIEVENSKREAQEVFNQRMASMDEEYELSDEDRKVIASDLESMEEENFKTYWNKMIILLSNKNKKTIEAAKAKSKTEEAEETTEATETNDTVVEVALEDAEKQEEILPASTEASAPTVYDKYRAAFGIDQFDITN